MKTVRINQLQIGELNSADGGWKYKSLHPATAEMDGCVFESLEQASDTLDDECIRPCVDLVLDIQGKSAVCRYKIDIS